MATARVPLTLHPDRLPPVGAAVRPIARRLYARCWRADRGDVSTPMARRHLLDEARSGRRGERDRAAVLGLAIIRVVALGFVAFLVLLAPL